MSLERTLRALTAAAACGLALILGGCPSGGSEAPPAAEPEPAPEMEAEAPEEETEAPPPTAEEVPIPADFADEAARDITGDNYGEALDALEEEIGAGG